MPRGGARPNSGPKKGWKQKATLGREIEQFRKTVAPARIANGGKVNVETFDGFEHMCKIAKLSIDQVVEQHKLVGKEGFDPKFYAACLRDAMAAAAEVTQYQRPTMRAIVIPAPPPDDTGQRIKSFTLTVFEGGRKIEDAEIILPEVKGTNGSAH